MRREAITRLAVLEGMLVEWGVPRGDTDTTWRSKRIARPVAERLIQRERKAGNIEQRHGRGLWSWVKKEEAA